MQIRQKLMLKSQEDLWMKVIPDNKKSLRDVCLHIKIKINTLSRRAYQNPNLFIALLKQHRHVLS